MPLELAVAFGVLVNTSAKMSKHGGAANTKAEAARRKRQRVDENQFIVSRGHQGNVSVMPIPPPPRLARPLAGETKYFDCVFSDTFSGANTTTWAGCEVSMSQYRNNVGTLAAYTDNSILPTSQGSGYGEVDGSTYYLKKIRVRGHIVPSNHPTGTTIARACAARILLVLDTQPNLGQAQAEEVMADSYTYGQCNSLMKVSDGTGRFRILKEKKVVIDPIPVWDATAGQLETGYSSAEFQLDHKFANPLKVSFKAGSGTPAGDRCYSHNVFLIAVATHQTNGMHSTTYEGYSRVYFSESI